MTNCVRATRGNLEFFSACRLKRNGKKDLVDLCHKILRAQNECDSDSPSEEVDFRGG